jgi:hypothetical protein
MAITVVETVLFSVQAGRLAFRVRRQRLAGGGHPDALARRLAGLDNAGLLHSTSWRFEGGAVVLTYAAVPDPTPIGATALEPERGAPYPMDPLAPGGVRLTAHDVAVHALRHLSYLRRTDPLVARASIGGADQQSTVGGADQRGDGPAELWEAIGRYEPALAGALGGRPITVLT